MRQNLQLTEQQHSFEPSQRRISATDAKGKILYCNDVFEATSGFTRKELIGSPHNIIRHSGMPPPVYEHMWQCLKADKSWMGIVKNCCKNDDHYWVDAHITPIFENGRLTGYESVRTQPRLERVSKATELYVSIGAKNTWVNRIHSEDHQQPSIQRQARRGHCP
jgi:aerotaxis receptor